MKTLYVTDLDGTLLEPDKSIVSAKLNGVAKKNA